MKRIAILGSTGSIGRQTLDVIRTFPEQLDVIGLAANKNVELLKKQIDEFHPTMFCSSIRPRFPSECQFVPMEEMASHPDVNLVIVATSGKAGLSPTLAALKAGKVVALASKEVLVMAGEIVFREAGLHQTTILPIDSEHSAIWQCLLGEEGRPDRLLLTASGGPLYRHSKPQLNCTTPEQALNHPTWKMGRKVTIDSATLMNKGLEVIEAHWLFHLPLDSIDILIHPQSVVHSMVLFADGSVKAQLSPADMRLPIQYAISYPQRWPNPGLPRLNWKELKHLDFEPVDYDRFPCLRLALWAGKSGGTYPAALCAADEVAVELFLDNKIPFAGIAEIVQDTLDQHENTAQPSLEEILAADARAREYATQRGLRPSR